MRRSSALAATALAAALAVAACGGSSEDDATATTSAARRDGDVRIVSLNVLHGFTCPPETDSCQADDRFELLVRQIEASRCPDVVALQEIDTHWLARIEGARDSLCDGAYTLVWHGEEGIDRELVLTTLEVESDELVHLAGGQRSAYGLVLRSDAGPLGLVVTHLGANQADDGSGGTLCRTERQCPPEPCPPGTQVITCQVAQLTELADRVAEGRVGVIVGDFNLHVTSPQVEGLLDDGWVDTHLAAGNPECDPATGLGCTSGREDQAMTELTDPASIETTRIDLALVRAPDDCEVELDGPDDADGDGLGTGLWAHEPMVDGPGGVVFVSDHTGVAIDVRCEP